MRIEYHRTLIADKVRNKALFQALKDLIVKDKTVVADIGTGTGFLALMALKLGAREVHIYESSLEMAELARAVLKKNNARNYSLYPCRSTEMIAPPKADLIISETLGNYALEENIIDTLNDARKRMLNAGGRLVPFQLNQYAAPVVSQRISNELNAWSRVGHDLDLSSASFKSLNNIYVRKIDQQELLGKGRDAKVWDTIDFTRSQKTTRGGQVAWELKDEHTIYGFAYWWEAQLSKGGRISTSPLAPPTHWEQLYFPLLKSLRVKKGDSVLLELHSQSSFESGTNLKWSVLHKGPNNKIHSRQSLDLNKGWIP